MKIKLLVLALVTLAWSAGAVSAKAATAASAAPLGATTKPPPNPHKPSKDEKDADKGQKEEAKDAAAAEKGAAHDAAAADHAAAKDAAATVKDAAKATKVQTKAETKAARAAAKELKFKRSMQRLGYTCRGGTTHVFATVVSITPSTPGSPATETTPEVLPTPPSMMIEVVKGNSRGRLLIGSETSITFTAGTEVIRRGTMPGIAGTLPVGSTIMIDLRLCTPPDTDLTDGVSPTPVLVARKIFARV
jgi:flagellar motor protein MotB